MSISIFTSQAIPAPSAREAEMGLRLANGVSAGDTTAETELVRYYERGVLIILTRVTGDPELARDLCQDTFVIVLKRLRSSPLEEPARLAAFIAQTARNLAIAEKRRDSRRRTEPDSKVVDATADDAPSREQVSEVESAATAVRRLFKG